MRRLSEFEDIVMKADARYFLIQGYISNDTYDRVFSWLDGKEDKEAQRIVTDWMKRDISWLDEILPTVAKHFGLVAPVVYTVAGRVREMTLHQIRELGG